MIADLYPEGALIALRILTVTLQNPKFYITKDERLDLEQFMADIQDALDNEAERQYFANINGA